MDENLHPKKQTDGSESLDDRRREDSLLITLTETIRGLEAVRRHRDDYNGAVTGEKHTSEEPGRGGGVEIQGGSEERTLSPAECEKKDEEGRRCADEEREEKECKKKVVRVLRELGVLHSDSLAPWGEALRECAHMLAMSPGGSSDQRRPSTTGDTECKTSSDSFSDTFLSVEEDIQNIMEKLNEIISNMDKEILKLCAEEASAVAADPKASQQPEDDNIYLSSNDPLEFDSKQDVEDAYDRKHTMQSTDAGQTPHSKFSNSDCNDAEEEESVVKSEGSDKGDFVSLESQTDFLQKTNENVKGKEETNKEWITVGLTGQQEDNHSGVPYACLIKAPPGVSEVLRCDVVDTLSYLMVTGSEELVSRVIRVTVHDGARFHFPVTVVVPFCAHYRGSYRDVVVKIVDEEGRSSYITPVTTEGIYGGQRGSFAEVRVYSLGLFAVVLCLKRENYTVPTKGLSLKLPMDPRICLNYLPGSFTAPVMAQIMIQPVDAVLLAAVKSRSDSYHSVLSSSPLLYLSHPTSQPLKRPLTLILPCPPNPEKKRQTRGQGEVQDHQARSITASPPWDQLALPRKGIPVASVKTKEISDDFLIALGSRDKLWSVVDKAAVRNQQNGLVSFEMTENFDRLLVVRLLSPLQPCHLTSLAEELEESVCRHSVTIVLQRKQDKPHAVLVAALPSRDLSWELSKLRAQGHGGLFETSSEISMCEGDQLVLRFSGNITSTGIQNHPHRRITFHSLQKNHLSVHLKEVDPFGNYSSPHYKGTVTFHRLTRGQLERRGDGQEPMDPKLLGDPVCKLSLTLPKKARTINRPTITRVKLCEETDFLSDSLLLWLSGQLSEEEVALLVLSLRLRRSAAQLVKLRARDSLSTQAFHALAMWRRGLPAAMHQPKASQLAHCLAKSGRPDLARELLVRQAAATRQGSLKQGNLLM